MKEIISQEVIENFLNGEDPEQYRGYFCAIPMGWGPIGTKFLWWE